MNWVSSTDGQINWENYRDKTFIIVVDDSGSLTWEDISTAILNLHDEIVDAGVNCIVLASCSSRKMVAVVWTYNR